METRPGSGSSATRLRKKKLAAGPLKALAFRADSRLLATGGRTGQIALWDLVTEKSTKTLRLEPSESVNDLAFTPDGQRLVVVANGSPILVLDGSSLTVLARFGISRVTLESLAIAPEREWIGTVYKDGTIRLWNLDGRMRAGWKSLMHKQTLARPHALAFAPDGRTVAVTGNHGFFWLADLSCLE